MHELLVDAHFEPMTLSSYWEDFERNFWRTGDPGFWKLERGQYFKEPGYDSWEAFARGDWATSLKLVEASLPEMREYYTKIARSGFSAKRVRVVEEPLTGYLQWELHVLRARDDSGGLVRVIEPDAIASWETSHPLPEIYTLGRDVMYEAIYDERGVLDSARKFTDRDVIEKCQMFIADLYAKGEPLKSYFDRRVADLPAPQGESTA